MCFENIPCKAFYSGKNGVWNDSQRMWDSETLAAYSRVCLHTHALARVSAYAGYNPRTWAERHFGLLISKNRFLLI